MINLLIGPPGGGKSYEAVVFHILPALANGRKVITNVPLDFRNISFIDPAYPQLIDLVVKTKADDNKTDSQQPKSVANRFRSQFRSETFVDRPFANLEDYGDAWRQENTKAGPLYVIDECHLALPRGQTKREVEEWFSLHRHESADVLLITQSYGKVSKNIIDLVQVCYRVKKGTAFGTSNSYIRKVQDGVRGDVVNTSVRKYEKRYFNLYNSHTRGGGEELAAQDITPIWKRWPFIGAALFIPAAIAIFFSIGSPNILKPKVPQHTTAAIQNTTPVSTSTDSKQIQPESIIQADTTHPFTGRTLHIIGLIKNQAKTLYIFAVAQNGQVISEVTSSELQKLGYLLEEQTPCAVKVTRDKWTNWIICDTPQVGVVPNQGVTSNARKS